MEFIGTNKSIRNKLQQLLKDISIGQKEIQAACKKKTISLKNNYEQSNKR